jgi:hypothetical protein
MVLCWHGHVNLPQMLVGFIKPVLNAHQELVL